MLRAGKGRYCSRRCRNRVHGYGGMSGQVPPRPKPRYGPDNPAWKGGVTFFKRHGNYRGVRYVRAPEWARPMARKDGYIMEHRLVMAAWAGRLLTRTETVNHVNHDPSDNRRENLDLWPTNADHKRGEVGRAVPGVANRRYLPV